MMSMQDLFYRAVEPVWIVKEGPGKKVDGKSEAGGGNKKDGETADYSVLSSIPYYPYYYPDYVPTSAKKEEPSKAADKKESRVVMKVPLCCGVCEELVESALFKLQGVKAVECNTRKERVTVISTTCAPADVLMECKKVFRKSRLWSDDD